LDERLVASGDFSMESGYRAMKELLQVPHRPTALFAGNDTIAVGAIAALREADFPFPATSRWSALMICHSQLIVTRH
jgi:DNA-binding LacI/PurR family transcriptional regulator